MKASIFYRIAAVLLLLFAAAHTFGFSQVDPTSGMGAVASSMQSVHFDAMGASRSYWDFFIGDGLQVGVLFLFAAVLAWQFGGLPAETLGRMRITAWAFVICFAVIAYLCWRYVFIVPTAFAAVITICLAAAALLPGRGKSAA
jgi:hypothetical protein